MDTSTIWRKRRLNALTSVVSLMWVVTICVVSELAIWGLSRALAPVHLEFFASVLGMLLVFSFMTVAGRLSWRCDKFYKEQIRSKVVILSQFLRDKLMLIRIQINFINAHLGVGFTIPIVMMKRNALDGRQIALVIGTFGTCLKRHSVVAS